VSCFRAIVLAAGKGTRLKSSLPKVLHPLMGKPLLKRVLEVIDELQVASLKVEQTCTIIGHQAGMVTEALERWQNESLQNESMSSGQNKSGQAKAMSTTVLQEPQLGTGHAVLQVRQQRQDWQNFEGTVLILSGDVPLIRAESLQQLLSSHQSQGHALTVLSSTMPNPFGYGRIVLDANNGVSAIVEEKDATPQQRGIQQVNTGIYCLNWAQVSPLLEQLSSQNAQGEFYLTDLVSLSVNAGFKTGFCQLEDANEVLGVNSRADLAHCHTILNQRTLTQLMHDGVTIVNPNLTTIAPEVSVGADSTLLPGCILEGDIQIGNNCQIGPYTVMSGKVTVGDNVRIMQSSVRDSEIGSFVTIGPYAQLRDEVKLADYVNIGNFVEIKQSRIDHHTNAAHLAYIGNATLGHDVNMGAGTITANYDPVRDIKSDTCIQNHAKIGSNSVLIAPVTIEEHASVAAGSVITQTVPKNSLAIARGRQTNIEGWVNKAKAQQVTAPVIPS
jgi:bifunctional UDP-N-acetylglucosamine pyrophosphorylase / glucosamine-1-phosphate N-acetyltransferase